MVRKKNKRPVRKLMHHQVDNFNYEKISPSPTDTGDNTFSQVDDSNSDASSSANIFNANQKRNEIKKDENYHQKTAPPHDSKFFRTVSKCCDGSSSFSEPEIIVKNGYDNNCNVTAHFHVKEDDWQVPLPNNHQDNNEDVKDEDGTPCSYLLSCRLVTFNNKITNESCSDTDNTSTNKINSTLKTSSSVVIRIRTCNGISTLLKHSNDNLRNSNEKNGKYNCDNVSCEGIGRAVENNLLKAFLVIPNDIDFTNVVEENNIMKEIASTYNLYFNITQSNNVSDVEDASDLESNQLSAQKTNSRVILRRKEAAAPPLLLYLFLSNCAFQICSPLHSHLSTPPLVPLPVSFGKRKWQSLQPQQLRERDKENIGNDIMDKSSIIYFAITVREAFAELYPNTLIQDLHQNPTGSFSPTANKSSTSDNDNKTLNNKSIATVTLNAKQIYKVVDNINLNKHNMMVQNLEKKEIKSSNSDNYPENEKFPRSLKGEKEFKKTNYNQNSIPGLKPNLRPYQQAAVNWMVQREMTATKSDTGNNDCKEKVIFSSSDPASKLCSPLLDANLNHNNNYQPLAPTLIPVQSQHQQTQNFNGWQLAWLIIHCLKYPITCNHIQKSHSYDYDFFTEQKQPKVEPLYQWINEKTNQEPGNKKNVIFYNPFTGWILNSYEQARYQTLFYNNKHVNSNISNPLYSGSLKRQRDNSSKMTSISEHNNNNRKQIDVVSGGILADSMGLGKTVEVLACILSNPCPVGQYDNFETEKNISLHKSKCAQFPYNTSGGVLDTCHTKIDNKSVNIESKATDLNRSIRVSTKLQEEKFKPYEKVLKAITNPTYNVENSYYNSDFKNKKFVCFCGKSGLNKHSLSWVICNKCFEPVHGRCAGFLSQEHLISSTYKATICSSLTTSQGNVYQMIAYNRCPCCVGSIHENISDTNIHDNSHCRLIRSRATLIVTPDSILNQWEREIKRHTFRFLDSSVAHDVPLHVGSKPLKVLVYRGIKELCKSYNPLKQRQPSENSNVDTETQKFLLIHPYQLADADIVLVSFQALMTELGHCADNPFATSLLDSSNSTKLRYKKKYRVVPSPLNSIRWWRVCLDEAQRVEAPTANSARMALKLISVHRWCVSGTPIARGKLDDLFGLLLFLGVQPFNNRNWFRHCFHSSHRDVMERIKCLLGDIFWRSTKEHKSVKEQMGIPEQIEKKVMLRFSSIERHFYEKQLEETLLAANTVIKREDQRRASKKSEVNLLSLHLHKLRAACCHPQVGSSGMERIKKKRKLSHSKINQVDKMKSNDNSLGILTMDQILDRLIDDAKTKAEEAQRILTLHANAIACLSNLKVEARQLGLISYEESDQKLLQKSADLYEETLRVVDKNSAPNILVGEARLRGCQCFQPKDILRHGAGKLTWQVAIKNDSEFILKEHIWVRFDFEGPAKKISEIHIRPLVFPFKKYNAEQNNGTYGFVSPKDCVLQVSNAALDGLFVDALSFTLKKIPDNTTHSIEWQNFNGIFTNKSKCWKLVVRTYHYYHHEKEPNLRDHIDMEDVNKKISVGLDIQLMEPGLASDSLQRLHILHNSSTSFSSLLQTHTTRNSSDNESETEISRKTALKVRISRMQEEAQQLEDLCMNAVRMLQRKRKLKLEEASLIRSKAEEEYHSLNEAFNSQFKYRDGDDFAPQNWWEDILVWCKLYGTEDQKQNLCDHVEQKLYELFDDPSAQYRRRNFYFLGIDGLLMTLKSRIHSNGSFAHTTNVPICIQKICDLSSNPSEGEIFENSHCGNCRSDWFQTGPMCRVCKLEKELLSYQKSITNEAPQKQKEIPEQENNCVLEAIAKWTKDNHHTLDFLSELNERAQKFFEFRATAKKELFAAKKVWKAHLNLLSNIDELNQCRRTMRLIRPGDRIEDLSEQEKAFLVEACDIAAMTWDHESKHAMATGNLKRTLDTLRYLKNLSLERRNTSSRIKKRNSSANIDALNEDKNADTCIICLSSLDGERAVLSCGHCYHYSCLERLLCKGVVITCPMRCAIRTHKNDILIATDRSLTDGSKTACHVEGSWGTKVDRLISDVLEVKELGEKSIVFSQWDDMLDIVEAALSRNEISFVRPKGGKQFGEDIKHFRSNNSSILILNIKNGAEGLTLVEASHIFMVEPLLNHGLDIQAINRIHRIGQSSKTYVHRYIVNDTIEVKIDKLRMERQENQIEDEIQDKHKLCSAGGMDGGFSQSELQDLFI